MKFNFNMHMNPNFNFKPTSMGKKGTFVAALMTVMLFLLTQYFYMIPMNIKNPAFIMFLMMMIGAFLFLDSALTGIPQRCNWGY